MCLIWLGGPAWYSESSLDLPPAGVAQLVEQLIRNQQVVGSSPTAVSSLRSDSFAARATAGKPRN